MNNILNDPPSDAFEDNLIEKLYKDYPEGFTSEELRICAEIIQSNLGGDPEDISMPYCNMIMEGLVKDRYLKINYNYTVFEWL